MRDASPVLASAGFFALYVVVATLSLPGAGILTLAAGAIFGLVWGVVLVSFASSLGATTAMLVARFLLHDLVQKRYGDKLKGFNAGFRKDGALYLAVLRMTGVPFFLINLVMGLTKIPAWTFYWVSQVSMIPLTIVFVYAGSQLATFKVSWQLFGALALAGLLPLVLKKGMERYRKK
jgi:uncharacterized membrane protein YdjX (TVP38/TMEM64 family)